MTLGPGLCGRELRNININQANRPAGDADMPDSTQSAIRDGQISTLVRPSPTYRRYFDRLLGVELAAYLDRSWSRLAKTMGPFCCVI